MQPHALKKSLGQHFLHDKNMLHKIAEAIGDVAAYETLLEIGPGAGALTQLLVAKQHPNFVVVEIDARWAEVLGQKFSAQQLRVVQADFLKTDLANVLKGDTMVVGNFPYNISSQILFRVLDHRQQIPQAVGMFQKEVAQRVAAKEGNKDYGILSILLQRHYEVKYLFDVPPECFSPPPKVMSGIIRLMRKSNIPVCDDDWLKRLVKAAFQQRRKTMRNSLRQFFGGTDFLQREIFNLRPEQLSVQQWIDFTNEAVRHLPVSLD